MFRLLRSHFTSIAMAAMVMLSVFGLSARPAGAASLGRKAVFVMTNSTAAGSNSILAFSRAGDGSLSAAGSFPTGGAGAAGLGSQGALTLSDDGQWLFAVNGGSNDISVLDVNSDGLTVASRVASGGTKPNSVTNHKNLVYVLNSGMPSNISGFRVDSHGQLMAIPGSTRPLSNANPGGAQVQFSPDGNWLVVTEKATQKIDTYAVNANGVASGPVTSPSNGVTPFGFGIDKRGHVIVSEAGSGAVSSYNVNANGSLSTISASVAATGQNAACWIAISKNSRYAYAANAASGTITGYVVAQDGRLSLVNGTSVTAAPGGKPLDMVFSENGQFLYVFNATALALNTYAVQADGSLVSLGAMAGFPVSATGIAAR
jgi:6-phosphogluconolactonase (cycloisomerase 2 family)